MWASVAVSEVVVVAVASDRADVRGSLGLLAGDESGDEILHPLREVVVYPFGVSH